MRHMVQVLVSVLAFGGIVILAVVPNASSAFAPGSEVQGKVFGVWQTCTTVGPPERFGGQVLHCPSLPDNNIFSASDVRNIGAAAAADQPAPQARFTPPASRARPPAPPRGRQVEGNVFGVWETCTAVSPPERFGGQVLHCPSLAADDIFSASDVREIEATTTADQPPPQVPFTPSAARAQPPAVPSGRQVQGNVFGVWEACTLLGKQQGSGGYLLHCPSWPDDSIFSESDVRP